MNRLRGLGPVLHMATDRLPYTRSPRQTMVGVGQGGQSMVGQKVRKLAGGLVPVSPVRLLGLGPRELTKRFLETIDSSNSCRPCIRNLSFSM